MKLMENTYKQTYFDCILQSQHAAINYKTMHFEPMQCEEMVEPFILANISMYMIFVMILTLTVSQNIGQ